ncbi:phosphatase PAP2 family protein [bacterium]|nr:phosphatase PAP2 family protein [bacterium]
MPRWLEEIIRRLGWFYTLAFGAAVLALLAFAKLADEVLETDTARFDRAVLAWVQTHVDPEWTPLVVATTLVGSVGAIVLFGVVFGLFLFARKRHADALTLAAVLAGGGGLTYVLKQAFRQTRPDLYASPVHKASYSFPSGHALMSVCFFGFLAYWTVAQGPREPWRWLVALCCLLLAGLISLSRLYLAVHWPSDIVAGALVGFFWLACCLTARRWILTREA